MNHLKLYQWTLSDGLSAQALIWHVLGDVGPIWDSTPNSIHYL